jgi:hypothetical protein
MSTAENVADLVIYGKPQFFDTPVFNEKLKGAMKWLQLN